MMRLDGKVAIITGAGQGIGRAYAQRFAAEGARVGVADLNDENAEKVAGEIGEAAIAVHVDVADEDSTKQMAATVLDRWGRIDILVNNAGIFYDLEQQDHSLAYLRKVLDVNMIGPWLGARAVVPAMKAQGKGKIINQSSGAAWMYLMAGYAMPKDSDVLPSFHYSLSKAGLNALTHFMAAALGKFGINVNAIAPGTTMTEATRKHVPEQMLGMIKMMSALGRTLEPEEIASAAVFLASDESDAITGQVLPVDAGTTMLG
ncbi:MAG TPA: glucose 1-dehydrogenase [Actinomycetota bacterium]